MTKIKTENSPKTSYDRNSAVEVAKVAAAMAHHHDVTAKEADLVKEAEVEKADVVAAEEKVDVLETRTSSSTKS